MPITRYQYTISTQTAAGKVYIPQLTYEIGANAAIGVVASYMDVNVEPNKLDVYMADALTAPQEAALTATVAAHQGYGIDADMQGTLPLVKKEEVITSDVDWEIIEGVVTTPSFFDPTMSNIISRIVGEHRGDGGELRLIEEVLGEADEEKIVPVFSFPNVGAEWTRFKIDSSVPPRDGLRNVYRTDCRLNGATSLALRYATISMITVRIV